MTFNNNNWIWALPVLTATPGSPISLWVCEHCGAMVMTDNRTAHDTFHERAPFDGE